LSDDPTARPAPGSDDFDPSRHKWDGNLWWTDDKKYWWDGSAWKSVDDPYKAPDFVGPVGRTKRPPGFWRDFWLGFFGVIALNVVMFIGLNALASANLGDVSGIVTSTPWVVNLIAIVVLAIVRVPALLGALTAYGVALGLALLAGIVFLVICFSGGGGVP
jgi:hypothetical protein